jgi:hypothetical protein
MTVGSPVFTVDRNRMSFDLAIDAQADCVDISGQCRADCEEVSGGLSGQCQRKGLIWIPNPSVGSVVTRNEVIVGPNGPGLEGLVLGTRSDAPAGSVQIEDNRIFNVHTGGIRFDAACAVCSVTNNVISIDTSKGTEAAAIGIAISGAVSEGTDDLSWNLLNNTVYFGNPRMSQETKPQRFGLFLPRRGRGHQVANNAIYADLSDQSKGLSCYGFWADPVQSLDDGLGLLRHSIRDRYRVLDYNACANSGDVNKLSWVNDLSWFIEGTMPGVFGTDQVTYERWTAPLTVMGVDLEEHDQYSVNNEDPLLNRDYQTVPTDANKRVYLSPLVVTSPLVDAGSALYTTPSGINFGVRGNMPDIGAFEFVE